MSNTKPLEPGSMFWLLEHKLSVKMRGGGKGTGDPTCMLCGWDLYKRKINLLADLFLDNLPCVIT